MIWGLNYESGLRSAWPKPKFLTLESETFSQAKFVYMDADDGRDNRVTDFALIRKASSPC